MELQLGAFITPWAANPEHVVAVAQAADDVGLNLVAFQDHPYQPRYLDTWTLMSFVAAKTSRVVITADVHCLPLRQPVVLARSAASLDRLSGGRVVLGLGTGAFWDAIVANGGPRRTPGEAVTAVSEAIDIARGLWDDTERSGLRLNGTQYQVVGAKRGPAPVHPIPIWLGAYGPRMLALTGAKADGWLPSLSRLPKLGALDEGNDRIDDAALAAGRDPAAVRRILNIGPQDATVDRITELAVNHRIDTFICALDDEPSIRHFGEQTVPAARAALSR